MTSGTMRVGGVRNVSPSTVEDVSVQKGVPETHAPMTTLIGRQEESALVMRLLEDPDVRLVVLTGPGGVGKTRFAEHVAELAEPSFADGVWMVPLAPVSDPRLVIPTIARALGFWDGSQRSIEQRLTGALAGKQALIVLDNIEQVASAGPRLVDLLSSCPGLTLLVTSRTVLRVSGEHNVPLPPLSLASSPASDDAGMPDAVRLFVERARAAHAGFELTSSNRDDVEAICRRLDGLPLAIELAAARVHHLTPSALLARLEHQLPVLTGGPHDRPGRLRSMRDAIGWSHDLLSPEQQALFRRISAFVGGASLPAIQAVGLLQDTTEGDDEWAAIDLLASLIDQSLVQQVEGPDGEPRFALLEPVRQFGVAQLAASGEEDDIRLRHATWCLEFAHHIRSTFEFRTDAGWRDLLDAEHPNLRSALAWLLDSGHVERYLELATALYPLWYYLGHSREGSDALQGGLARAGDMPAPVRLQAALVATELVSEQCRHELAATLGESAERIAREIDDRPNLAWALYMLGRNDHLSGNVERGRARILEALALWQELGDRISVAHTNTYLAMLGSGDRENKLDAGDRLDVARRCWELELGLFREQGNMVMTTRALHGLGYVAYLAGDYPKALEYSHQALQMRWRMGETRLIPAQLEDIGDIARATGKFEVAVRFYGAAALLRTRTDIPIPWWFQDEYDSELDACRKVMTDRRFDAAWAAGQSLTLAEVVAEALAFRLEDRQTVDVRHANPYQLTDREIDVLRLLIEGRSNPQIADALFISRKTVANHVGNIFGKLGVESRTAAVSRALREELA